MKFSYVLPDPASYRDWDEFDGDLACMRRIGYDAVELQIPDPAQLDEPRVRRSMEAVGYSLCAFQTGSTYASRGNCLSTKDEGRARVNRATPGAIRPVGLALEIGDRVRIAPRPAERRARREVGEARIAEAMRRIGQLATARA